MAFALFYDWLDSSSFATITPTSTGASPEIGSDIVENAFDLSGCSLGPIWRGNEDLTVTLTTPTDEAEAFVVAGTSLDSNDIIEIERDVGAGFVSLGFADYNASSRAFVFIPPLTGSPPVAYRITLSTSDAGVDEILTSFIGLARMRVDLDDANRPLKDWGSSDLSLSPGSLGGRLAQERREQPDLDFPLRAMRWDDTQSQEIRAMVREVRMVKPIAVVLDEENLDLDGNFIFGSLARMPAYRGHPGRFFDLVLSVLAITDGEVES